MRYSLENYIETVDLDHVAVPDWSHLNVNSKETLILSFDDIHIDDITGNNSKEETHTHEEIENLRMSFSSFVDTSEFPPAVRKREDKEKKYELVYGFGRSEAIQALKQKKWTFTLLEGSDDGIEDVQASENEGLPKRLNKEVDMIKFLSNKIRSGSIKNSEDAIRKKFKKVYSNRTKDVENRVVQMVISSSDTPQPYQMYTSVPRVKQWLENHSSEEYCIGGDYDENRDACGVVIKQGYLYRVVCQALRRYRESGNYTYIIGHVDSPTKNATIDSKRKAMLKELEELKLDMQHSSPNGFDWPIWFMGFLPQDKSKENLKELVKVS